MRPGRSRARDDRGIAQVVRTDWRRYWRAADRPLEAMHAGFRRHAYDETAAGFAGQAHLIRWFVRCYGVTPAAYARATG